MSITSRAIAFLEQQDRPVEPAWARYSAGQGTMEDVIDALEGYQNDDGGFGRHLEIDIHAPDSQPFAARLAMLTMIDVGVPADAPIVVRLAEWLEREQGEDGDWRFPPGVYQHQLAPWFAGWEFPALNPALCVAGGALRLGIGSDRLFSRIDQLIAEKANLDEAEHGEFYGVLPYAEYFPWSSHPDREQYLDAIARGIEAKVNAGKYDDASHVFTHAGGPDNPISLRLPGSLVEAQLDRLESEQQEDGGWPSPYDPAWRPMITAAALAVLRSYGRLAAG
jgi:hypothetical protein